MEAAAQLADRFGRFQQGLCGHGADTNDVLGTNDFELPLEKRPQFSTSLGDGLRLSGGRHLRTFMMYTSDRFQPHASMILVSN